MWSYGFSQDLIGLNAEVLLDDHCCPFYHYHFKNYISFFLSGLEFCFLFPALFWCPFNFLSCPFLVVFAFPILITCPYPDSSHLCLDVIVVCVYISLSFQSLLSVSCCFLVLSDVPWCSMFIICVSCCFESLEVYFMFVMLSLVVLCLKQIFSLLSSVVCLVI